MRIAVIGAGAMGSIYGGHLSQHNDVLLVDTNEKVVEQVSNNGLLIDEDGTTHTYHPGAVSNTQGQAPADLVILFVKALFSRAALEGNRGLIGPNTSLMTLQNGAGHEDLLKEFVDEDHIVIGTTEDNGAVLGMGHVRRGGTGVTNVGMLVEDKEGFLPQLKEAFDQCGFNVKIHENIQTLIWDKLFTNVSLSALTGVLQVDMGYIAANEYAWDLCCQLIVFRKKLLIDHHQSGLSDCSTCLFVFCLTWSVSETCSSSSDRNRPGRYHNHIFAHIMEITDLTHQNFQFRKVQRPCLRVSQGRRTNLYHNSLFIF